MFRLHIWYLVIHVYYVCHIDVGQLWVANVIWVY